MRALVRAQRGGDGATAREDVDLRDAAVAAHRDAAQLQRTSRRQVRAIAMASNAPLSENKNNKAPPSHQAPITAAPIATANIRK